MRPLPKGQGRSGVKERSRKKGSPTGRYDGSAAAPVFPGLLHVEGGKGNVLPLDGKWASKRGLGRKQSEGGFFHHTDLVRASHGQ